MSVSTKSWLAGQLQNVCRCLYLRKVDWLASYKMSVRVYLPKVGWPVTKCLSVSIYQKLAGQLQNVCRCLYLPEVGWRVTKCLLVTVSTKSWLASYKMSVGNCIYQKLAGELQNFLIQFRQFTYRKSWRFWTKPALYFAVCTVSAWHFPRRAASLPYMMCIVLHTAQAKLLFVLCALLQAPVT